MENVRVDKIKQYIQFKHLLGQGKQTLPNNSSFQNYSRELKSAYKSGKSFSELEKDITSLQSLQDSNGTAGQTDASYTFSEGQSIVEQFRYNKTYADLVKEAQSVFTTSAEFESWKEQLDIAYNNHLKLDTYDYSLEMFDTLQMAEKSPVYQDKVNNLVKDDTHFDQFVELSQDMGNQYQDVTFSGTNEFNTALEGSAVNNGNNSMFTPAQEAVNRDVTMPQTNKSVLIVEGGVVQNTEAFFNSDGVIDPAQLTTKSEQDNKEAVFKGLIEGCETQQEVDEVVEAFQPETLPTTDKEAPLPDEERGVDEVTSEQSSLDASLDSLSFEVSTFATLDYGNISGSDTYYDESENIVDLYTDMLKTFQLEGEMIQ